MIRVQADTADRLPSIGRQLRAKLDIKIAYQGCGIFCVQIGVDDILDGILSLLLWSRHGQAVGECLLHRVTALDAAASRMGLQMTYWALFRYIA